jgi:hypothetical protein
MANQPGSSLPTPFRPGQALSAKDLNRIVLMVVQRITGGKGIRVRSFGGQIVLESTPTPSRKGGEGTANKVGLIVSGSDSGPYVVDVYDDGIGEPATEQVNAYPLSGVDFSAGVSVVLIWVKAADEGEGLWYFQDPTASSTTIGYVAAGSGSGPYTINVMGNGTDQSPTASVSAYPLQIASGQSFPANTGVLLVWIQGADGGNGRWYFQGPVWLSA